ncbi:MAG: hypothetical protein OEW40_21720 [Cyclobacteriaceae bacterium]|jgi:hypothetical protein|nr:hypothetical protein [Cyclobacteriaceae bacterium]
MKQLAILVSLSLLLSSCFSYKNLTKKEPITKDFLSKLEPGKKYKFVLNTGLTQIIRITSMDDETIVGFIRLKDANGILQKVSYSSSFENIEKYVAKISVWKVDAPKTFALITVGGFVAYIIISLSDGLPGGFTL